jgi:hypothetical protein
MKLIAYCYGPASADKNLFVKKFLSENKNYKFLDLHKIRKKNTGSILPKDKASELALKSEVEKKCLSYFEKNNSLLINGLFLNKESRIAFLSSIEAKVGCSIKKVALAFKPKNLSELLEKNQKDKIYKCISFDELRKQDSIFTKVSSSEEADLVIDEINFNNSPNIEINTKLWGEDRIITCDSFKKLSEYFRCSTSFV